MPKTIEVTVYTFDELNDKAKENARDWFREDGFGYDWWDSVYQDAVTIGALFGLEISTRQQKFHVMGRDGNPGRDGVSTETNIMFSGFSSQGDGASFEGSYTYKADALAALESYLPNTAENSDVYSIVEQLQKAQTLGPVCESVNITHRGYYSHSGCMDFEFVDEDESVTLDEVAPECIRESEKAIMVALRSFADWIYKRLESEWDYLNSAESVDDTIRANEYEFLETGERA